VSGGSGPIIPGIVLQPTNLFNFGTELDRIDRNVTAIINNQTTFFQQIEAEQTTLATQVSQSLANLNETIGALAVLVQAAILGLSNTATAAGQQQIIALLQQIVTEALPTAPIAIGLDLQSTATTKQEEPAKPGP
jgi:hypothetical protein